MTKITEVPLARCQLDDSIYPRFVTGVDSMHISNMARAIEAMIRLPPIVLERKTYRVVDGRHRLLAYRAVLGSDAKIPAEFRSYRSTTALLEDAVRLNAANGRPLNEVDKRQIVLSLRKLGAEDSAIASALHTTQHRVLRLALMVGEVQHSSPPTALDLGSDQLIPLKGSLVHFRDKEMTPAQVIAHRSAPGVGYLLAFRQVYEAVKFDLYDKSDKRQVDYLRKLAEVLRPLADAA